METHMKATDTRESLSSSGNGHISSENSNWLAKDLEEMDHTVKRMLKLMEDGESSSMDAETHKADIKKFCHLYRSLAERYDHLTGELQKNLPSKLLPQGSPLHTPDQKMGSRKSVHQVASLSSGGVSSDFSNKGEEESESSVSSSSSDSESYSLHSFSSYYTPMNLNKGVEEIIQPGFVLPSMKKRHPDENMKNSLEVEQNGSYKELLGRVVEYEEKLRVSEEEILRLKGEMKMRDADLELERKRTSELRDYITDLESQVSESNSKIEKLMEELEECRERLKGLDEEMGRLKSEFADEISKSTNQVQGQLRLAQEDVAILKDKLQTERKQVLEFQERIATYENDLSARDDEVSKLKVALSDAHESFSSERAHFQSDIFDLSKKQTMSDARIKEWELQFKSLEDKLRQSETGKIELKNLLDSIKSALQGEINALKGEVANRGDRIEALNKDLDGLKLKYDTLMAEKDEVTAKVNNLMAESTTREIMVRQLEEQWSKLQAEHCKLISGSDLSQKLVNELRLRVDELEKEVDRQKLVILDGAEEKREVIRQLCFSLEHYRNGYKELCQVLGHKRHMVMAA